MAPRALSAEAMLPMKEKGQSAAQIQTLLTRFRRQKPVRAGSLLVTILGDAIAPRGGSIALTSLIALAHPFGITERLVRTTVGRLASEDWVDSKRNGRASYYMLSGQGRARFAEATQRIYSSPVDTWRGEWTLVILPPVLERSARDQLREALLRLGFGELNAGVFAHPMHDVNKVRQRLEQFDASDELIVAHRTAMAQESEARIVARCWDLAELARRYQRFISMFEPIDRVTSRSDVSAAVGETAFTLRTLLLHEYRKIHLRDPLLPIKLLPPNWVGTDARELCRRLYVRFFQASEQYLSATVQTMKGQLPRPGQDIYRRFGGLPASAQ